MKLENIPSNFRFVSSNSVAFTSKFISFREIKNFSEIMIFGEKCWNFFLSSTRCLFHKREFYFSTFISLQVTRLCHIYINKSNDIFILYHRCLYRYVSQQFFENFFFQIPSLFHSPIIHCRILSNKNKNLEYVKIVAFE